jgi:hypothetical protein
VDLAAGDLIARARSGDEQAYAELVGPYRAELLAHCYRILGTLPRPGRPLAPGPQQL